MPIFTRPYRALVAAAAALAAMSPTVVQAQPPAVAAKWVNLRAGPARDYPLVLRVGPGTPLAVQGCIDGYSWCDVVVPGNYRGWVYAGNINYAYQRERVPLLEYGPAIGLPIIGFSLGSYWGDYYRNRPFYRDRARWEHRPMPNRREFAGPPPYGRGGDRGPRQDFGRPIIGRPDGGRPNAGRPGGGQRDDGRLESGRPEGVRTDGGPRRRGSTLGRP